MHAIIALTVLGLLPPASAADPTTTGALEDAAANLHKTLAGYKVGDPARYRDLFEPLRTELAALSPDGVHLAYTERIGENLYVDLIEVDQPDYRKIQVLVLEMDSLSTLRGRSPARWLGWVNSNRVAIDTERYFPIRERRFSRRFYGEVIAFDADGSNPRVLANPQKVQATGAAVVNPADVRVVGRHPELPDTLVVAAHSRIAYGIGRGTGRNFIADGAHAIDATSGKITTLTTSETERDEILLVDGYGRGRISVSRLDLAAPQPLHLVTASGPQEPLTLNQATGLKGFSFETATVLGERSVPLGFSAGGNVLHYASNVGRDTFGVYSLDLETGQRLPGSAESPEIDLLSPAMTTFDALDFYSLQEGANRIPLLSSNGDRRVASPQLVTDLFTHQLVGLRYVGATRTAAWLRPELQAVQERLAAERPGRSAEIMEWDESLNRFLIREQSPIDAGAFLVLDLEKGTCTNFVRRGPEPEDGSIAQLTSFDFKLADGSRIDGLIALPKDSKVKKIPLVLLCPDFPWQRRGASYQPEFEALTRMGFAVAIYNGRGAWGTGIKERQKLKGDYVGVQVADAVAVADHLAATFPNVSAKAVALFGQGHGGHVALRALQLHPQRFRCAVTVDAWIQGNALLDAVVQSKELKGSYEKATRPTPTPLTEHPELIKSPVFTIVEFSQTPRFHANTALYRAVKRNAPESELFVQTDKFAERPEVLARQWARTESFLNYVLYNFSVKIGELEVLPDAAKPKQP